MTSSKVLGVTLESLKVSCEQCNLRELCFPHGMSDEDMQRLDAVVEQHRPLQKNNYLYHQGDRSFAIYAVRSGSVKTFIESQNGDEQIVSFHLPGELLGFDGFMDETHSCSAVALETSSVCELPLDKIEELCHTLPNLQHQMRRIMGKEVSDDHAMLLLLGKMGAEEKVATFLLSISKRMQERHWKSDEFMLSMPRQDIANYLGLAVETVSRLFAHYQEEGTIKVDRRHVTITNMEHLKEIVGECRGGNESIAKEAG